jgi:hypothetical protein
MTVAPSAVVVALLLALAVVLVPSGATADKGLGTGGHVSGGEESGTDATRSSDGADHGRPLRGPARRRDAGGPGDAEVSAALTLLALAYRSGLPTWDVLLAVADGSQGRVSQDLRQVAAALRWGADEAEAWGSVGAVWSPAARAVAIAQQAGVPPSSMLVAAAGDLRRAELDGLEIRAAKAGVRLVAPLGLVLLPAFCLTTVVPLVVALGRQLITA